jgi:endogenous inhibitor of DNA gyrase (YacG/DUF329 family)
MTTNCPKCETEFDDGGKWGKRKFCSRKCANSRSWSDKDKKLRKVQTLNSKNYLEWLEVNKAVPLIKNCIICGNEFSVPKRHGKNKTCGGICAKTYKSIKGSEAQQKRFRNNPEERKRMRDIGRKGGFGKKGYLPSGVRYESSIEKFFFDQLEVNNIKFDAHKHIPNSSKVSDAYIPDKNLWVEVDGIDRDKRRKWLENEYKYWVDKLDTYHRENLSVIVVKNKTDILKLVSVLLDN